MSQSTNDVYPTALKLAAYSGIMRLVDAMAVLRQAFEAKSEEFKDIIKMGRTQLQDAVPMTLGQEFSTYAVMLGEDEQRLKEAVLLVCEINMGATAIGTGINAHPDYARLVCRAFARRSPAFRSSPRSNLIEATQDCGSLRAALRRAEAGRGQAVEDLQRFAPAVVGPPRRAWRNQPAADAGRLQHHAGQGQPGYPRGRQPDRLRGDRQRHHGQFCGRGRSVAAERLRADHRAQPVQERQPSARRLPDAGRQDA